LTEKVNYILPFGLEANFYITVWSGVRISYQGSCSGTLAPSSLVGGWWAVGDGGCEAGSSGLLEAAGCRLETGLIGPDGTNGSSSAPLATASGGSGSLSSAAASETSSDVRSAIANMAAADAGGSSPR
jgi:hypothetical protein